MRVPLKELLGKLGVDRELEAYETYPWFYQDDEKGISCSAEVRMGPRASDLEAEIQFLYEEREKDEEEGDGEDSDYLLGGHKQIMRMRALPITMDQWSPKECFIEGEDFVNKIGDWEKKVCEFFKACIASILMSELPDIEELTERELADDDARGGGRRGRIGRKSPKVKPGALLGMKK